VRAATRGARIKRPGKPLRESVALRNIRKKE
jgi:hypothetical protein